MVGTFVAASVWMMRTSILHQRGMTDRFIQHLEKLILKNEEESKVNRTLMTKMVGAIRRNSSVVSKLQKEIRNEFDGDQSNRKKKVQN